MDHGRGELRKTIFHHRAAAAAGYTFLFTVFALTTLSAIAAALATISSSADQTPQAGADALRARYLALSGLNLWTPETTGTFTLGVDAITIGQLGPDSGGVYAVTSTGTVRAGTSSQTSATVTARRGGSGSTITFDDDIDAFKTPVVGKTTNSGSAVQVYGKDVDNAPATLTTAEWTSLFAQNASRYAGGWVRLGGGAAETTGAVWYTGDKGSCQAGACALGTGFRAYFGFAFSGYDTHAQSKTYGDGFTFAVITAANDPATAAGGPAAATGGEYLGYAGPGPSGKGIAPPKMAVEIDTYPNRGSGDPKSTNSRRDASNANHVAVVYWGDTATSYDDNVHGAGTDPVNPSLAKGGYYEKAATSGGPQWLEDGEEHSLRLELLRTSASGGGSYTLKVWIDPEGVGKSDVSLDYTAQTPQVVSAVSLDATNHAGLDAVRFGFTEATSSAVTQDVAVHGFSLRFRE
ncbi:hypothetical protein [Solidesulfovibrio sp.]|uniref:hypothetical protein n=1 Tax=Solidesulfovibrio sp. TaxID=2910990 RepID=UPI00261789F4|nr:hypothetical protein [Solidesulfovibrio sp.]